MQIPFQLQNETIYLIADGDSYALARLTNRTRNGVTTPAFVAYKWFATIGGALNRIIDFKIKSSDAKTLLELKAVIEAAQAEVTEVWKAHAQSR
jgi:hypothetical protein